MMALTRFQLVSDTHGDVIDKAAAAAAIEFAKHFKPKLKIHTGDFTDVRALRRGASESERAEGITADVEAGIEFIREFGAQHVMWGNHDYRLVREAKYGSNGIIKQHCKQLIDRIIDGTPHTHHIPYGNRQGVFELAKGCRLVHGYQHSIMTARAVATAYAPPGGIAVMGHVHTEQAFVEPCFDGRKGYTIPCLCDLNLEYTIGYVKTLGWTHGWAYGVIDKHGNVVLWQAQKLGDQWVYPSEMRTL